MIYLFLFLLILTFAGILLQGFITFLIYKEMRLLSGSVQKIEAVELARGLQSQALKELPEKIGKTQIRSFTDEELYELEQKEFDKEFSSFYGEQS